MRHFRSVSRANPESGERAQRSEDIHVTLITVTVVWMTLIICMCTLIHSAVTHTRRHMDCDVGPPARDTHTMDMHTRSHMHATERRLKTEDQARRDQTRDMLGPRKLRAAAARGGPQYTRHVTFHEACASRPPRSPRSPPNLQRRGPDRLLRVQEPRGHASRHVSRPRGEDGRRTQRGAGAAAAGGARCARRPADELCAPSPAPPL